ncbi:lipoxygenase [Aspergillus egyptiacus]|nr:lipoxygenase [Aspergillus egyptiacus]
MESFMEVADFDSSMPLPRPLEEKQKHYLFTSGKDGFPPHLNLVGKDDEEDPNQRTDLPLGKIFDRMRILQASSLMRTYKNALERGAASAAGALAFGRMENPYSGTTLKDVENYNRKRRESTSRKDIFDQPNVGDLEDWFSDARFAQQFFTGVNPTTIERASDSWLDHFVQAAEKTEVKALNEALDYLKKNCRESLYMQDYSYFRKAAGVSEDQDVKCPWEETNILGFVTRKGHRYSVASVCLFYLDDEGNLLPLAIVPDWLGSADKSVTIFNRTLFKSRDFRSGTDKRDRITQLEEEANDWPWRYAKTCVQCSDWLRHEVTVHLTDTHFVEEAIIVASHRQLEQTHPVMQLLVPHWRKTLALNASARLILVPHVVLQLIGFQEKEMQRFMWNAYTEFDFKKKYVPTDLEERGFPPEKLGERKFHNYAYAKCINSMWGKIRAYVKDTLAVHYSGPDVDSQVKQDKQLQAWVKELASDGGARLKFPTIQTFDELVDCVTMCIHVASPQHTAVNYLQNYYLAFVVNRPPCLYKAPPKTLDELIRYTEKDLVEALPMNHSGDWLLASHIPYLLNKKPTEEESLLNFAHSKTLQYLNKSSDDDLAIAMAALDFFMKLVDTVEEFKEYGQQVDGWQQLPYEVLYPDWNAVSILI